MPSGPERFVTQPGYSTELERARDLLLAHPKRWRVIYHYDGDGIASASSAVRALRRLGFHVQATAFQGVERSRMAGLLKATPGPAFIVDTGASWPELYVDHPFPVVVLDHHQYPGSPTPPHLPSHVAFVNPLDWGVDGMSELCAATLTWLFTVFVDARNWDNAPWGLSGAIADRQHVGGFKGLNAKLVEEAVGRSLVVRRRGLSLFGPNLREAIARSVDPYVVGLSSRPESVETFLLGLSLAPTRSPTALDPEEEKRLASALVARLASQGTRPEFVEALTQEHWHLPGLGVEAEELSNLQNATGRLGTPGIGIALALGDTLAWERARAAEEGWRTGILAGLHRLENEGVNSMNALQWFESPDTTLAGTQAGLAMNYLIDSEKPVFVFSSGVGDLKVSARGTLYLVSRGLDLSRVCRDVAHAVGGEGGGHPVASGATIPAGSRDAFLQEADRRLVGQLTIRVGSAS